MPCSASLCFRNSQPKDDSTPCLAWRCSLASPSYVAPPHSVSPWALPQSVASWCTSSAQAAACQGGHHTLLPLDTVPLSARSWLRKSMETAPDTVPCPPWICNMLSKCACVCVCVCVWQSLSPQSCHVLCWWFTALHVGHSLSLWEGVWGLTSSWCILTRL